MAKVILSIFFLIVFAILIILNLDNRAAFNVFGYTFEDLPTTAVAIVSFVLGVLYSFIYYLFSYFGRKRKEKIQKTKKKLVERETSLKEREQNVDEKITKQENAAEQAEEAASKVPKKSGSRPGLFRKLTGRRKK